MFLNEDESELQKTKTSENFNSKISKKKNFISNDICDPDEINNFIRFDEVININTLGSQPVIMFKKVQRLYNPKDDITTKTKPTAKSHEKVLVNNFVKPNYIMDGGLQQKLNKYKTNLINVHSQSPVNKTKIKYKSKTNRNIENTKKRPKTQKAVVKNKEFIPKTAKTNIRHNNQTNNKLNLKKEKTNPNLKHNSNNNLIRNNNNLYKNNKKPKKEKKSSNNKIIDNENNNKFKSDTNTIENEEQKKNEYMNDLIKNGILGFAKELEAKKKKLMEKTKTDRKLDFLRENGIDKNDEDELENGIVLMGKSKEKNLFKIKKIKPKKKIKIEKLNTNNINNIDNNIHTENDKFLYNNLTSSNNILTSEFSKNLTKNKNISSNNYEFDSNKLNLEQEIKKKICKPKISQFEFLQKIRNFKKIQEQKQKNSPEINNSFKFSQLNKLKNKLIKKSSKNLKEKEHPKKNIKEMELIQKNDEFLYADKISHRTQTELEKFKKKKKMEKKREESEEMRKKQDKILNTLQNLIRLGEECKYNNTNNSPIKQRNDSKNHIKKRKIINEYYIGTEESKNNTSTFIDKQEYYKSIIESKNVLNYSKVEKTETNGEDNNNINNNLINTNNNINININDDINTKNITTSYPTSNNLRKLSSENNSENYNKNNNNNIILINNKVFKNYEEMKSKKLYKDNKLSELRTKVINTIKRSNELFNKENIKRIKSDLSDNNNLIKSNFENKILNKNIFNKNNIKINDIINNNNKEEKKEKDYKKLEKKIKIFENISKTFFKKRFWIRFVQLNKEKKIKMGIEFIIGFCKVYQFKKIQKYIENMKWSKALMKLISPFIHHEFKLFIEKLQMIIKIKYFEKAITRLCKYKILKKLFKYYTVIDFWKNIIIPGGIILQHIILKNIFQKLKNFEKSINLDFNYNINRNIISRSYLNSHCLIEEKKANSYIYESLDCADSISVHPNSEDNDGLHQLKEIIELQNENRLDDSIENANNEESVRLSVIRTNSNNSINTLDSINNQLNGGEENSSINDNSSNENKIKTEFHIKETLLRKLINSSDTSNENKNDIQKKENEKEEKDDLILTKINDDKDNEQKINKIPLKEEVIKNLDNFIKSQNESTSSEIIQNQQQINKNIQNLPTLLNKIKDVNKFADELTDQIISKILIEKEIKSPSEKLIPYKSGELNYKKYSLFDQSLLASNNLSELSNTLESLTGSSLAENSQLLEKSVIFQYSISSEFNKTIKEQKNKLETNLYNDYIIEKLILLICKEIQKNYSRIYDNICIPYKANYEQIIVASFLQDNELLNDCYKELNVKEELKNILNKNEILEKFSKINKKIRKKKGLEEDNFYDNLINECIIDATVEIINKERYYGEQGEPFPFSKREKILVFKYKKDDPKPLMRHVYKEIKKMLFGKGNIIKENSPIFDKNDPFLMNIFKKEMENKNIWSELEIQEEQVKSIASSVIFEQLINEVIEILEHVQLNRKRPELYQDKSIYACDDIPRLSFQMISTNTENDND